MCIYNVGAKEAAAKCGVDLRSALTVGEGPADALVAKSLKEKATDIIVVGDLPSVGHSVACPMGGSVENVVKCGYSIVSIAT